MRDYKLYFIILLSMQRGVGTKPAKETTGDKITPKTIIKVGTLNYSGVLTSPYEYYEKEDEEQKLISAIFEETVAQKYPEFKDPNPEKFTWDMGCIDSKWKTRYSPTNIVDCGVNQNQNMMSQPEFLKKWDEVYEQTKGQLQKDYFDKKYSDQSEKEARQKIEIGRCREFDLFCYRAIFKVFAKQKIIKSEKPCEACANDYLQKRKIKFDKAYLKEEKKVQKTVKSIINNGYDCFCLQEANNTLIEACQKYMSESYYVLTDAGTTSCIILKKSSFAQFNPKEENARMVKKFAKPAPQKEGVDLFKLLNFNKDTIFQALPGDILILSIHLSSKKEINKKQMIEMKQTLEVLKKIQPDVRFILAGDLNAPLDKTFLAPPEQKWKLSVFPEPGEYITANKKRTMMQPQRHKAQKLDQMSKDFIFTDFPMSNSKVQLINGECVEKGKNNTLLPTDEHPYDHYSVVSEIHLK